MEDLNSENCETTSDGREMFPGQVKYFACDPSAYGTAVRITADVSGDDYVTLCEVYVYATGMVELNKCITLNARAVAHQIWLAPVYCFIL